MVTTQSLLPKSFLVNHPLKLIGVDEAGRGALAGPVVACAVSILPSFTFFEDVADSKVLTQSKRDRIYAMVRPHIALGIGIASHRYIDRYNILKATLIAMEKAVRRIPTQGGATVIVDGNHAPRINMPCEARVKADATVTEVMLASICAKVLRDRLMQKYHRFYPRFGFDRHKGYGTRDHYDALHKGGHSHIHRTSFNLNKQLELFES